MALSPWTSSPPLASAHETITEQQNGAGAAPQGQSEASRSTRCCRPLVPSIARLLLILRELTPAQPSSPESRPYSILGQRFITTFSQACSASFAASSLRTPICIHTTLAPISYTHLTLPTI